MRVKFFQVVLISFILVSTSFSSIYSVEGANNKSNILFVAPTLENAIQSRFQLDPQFNITFVSQLNNVSLNNFDSLVLFDYVPRSISEIQAITSFSGGIAFFNGVNVAQNTSLFVSMGLTTSANGTIISSLALPVPNDKLSNASIVSEIQWNSVVRICNFTDISISGDVLVKTSSEGKYSNIPLITQIDRGKFIVVNFLPSYNDNSELIQWPYFNYLLYLIMTSINTIHPLSYADWQYSPVPHKEATIFLGLVVLLISLLTIGVFIYAKRYSKSHPIHDKELKEMSKDVKEDKDWEDVGMHRQLAGFFVQLFIGLLIILPNVVMTSLVFPLFVLPSPQAAGFYDFTVHFFEALWLFFDVGTSVVLVKFFSQHRVKNPQQAVKYVQIFIYYQMISGILQLFLISFLGSMIFPHTFLAHLSWMFVTHAFFQWPSFFLVFMLMFQAMNRHDLFQILNILIYAVLNITVQYAVIIIFRFTLGKNPVFGDGLAGAIGYSVGNYVNQVIAFLIGLWLFKRQHFSLKTIFRIDFSWTEIKESLKFGFKWMIGNILPPLGWFIQMYLLSIFLPNYTEQQGYFSIAWNFALIVMIAGLFAQSILPGVSESYHAKKPTLTRYYTVNALKWSAYFDWFFVAALLAVGPRFIIGGAGIKWADAAIIIRWILLFHFLGYFSWIGDWLFAGSDRPGWAAISWTIEQVLRAALLFFFVRNYQFFTIHFKSPMVAVMFAYIPALIIKNIFMWWGIRRDEFFKFSWKDLYYQGLIAPFTAAVALFGVLDLLFMVIWQGEIITSVVILVIGVIGGLYIFAFFDGLIGGFDDNTLAEFKRSVNMVKGVGFMAKPLYKVTEWGAKLSPLHNKFPIKIYDQAIKEAEEITKEKAKLII